MPSGGNHWQALFQSEGKTVKHFGLSVMAGCIMALPALLFLSLMIHVSIGQYYDVTNVTLGMVFVLASLAGGIWTAERVPSTASTRRIGLRMLLSALAAWAVAIVVLGVLSVTPLCVGRDNGDGMNDLGQCGAYVVLVTAVYSPPLLLLLGLASMLSSSFLRRRNKQHAVPPEN